MHGVRLQLMRQAALSWSETARLMTFTFSQGGWYGAT